MKTFEKLNKFLFAAVLVIFTATTQLCIAQTAISKAGFTKNMGQLLNTNGNPASNVLYHTKAGKQQLYLLNDRLSYVFSKVDTSNGGSDSLFRVDMRIQNMNTTANIAEGAINYYKNFYLAHTGAAGITNVGVRDDITYQNVISGVNMLVENSNGIKYSFAIAAGTNPGNLKIYFQGASSVAVNGNKSFTVATPAGVISFDAPTAYQTTTGNTIPVNITTAINGSGVISFVPDPATYNPSLTLTIKTGTATAAPVQYPQTKQYWTTFIQGGDFDNASDVCMDAANNVYVSGYTFSSVYPLTNGQYLNYVGNSDAFVIKFNPQRGIAWGSYFGGTGSEINIQIAVNSTGYVYIAGSTASINIPACATCTADPLYLKDNTYNGGDDDIFIAKFAPDGSLNPLSPLYPNVFATYFGGSGGEEVRSITIDNANNVYLGGFVQNSSYLTFPKKTLTGAYNQNFDASVDGVVDAFISKINTSNNVVWSTAIGGGSTIVTDEWIDGMTTDAANNLYVTGMTSSQGQLLTSPVTVPSPGFFPLADPAGTTDFVRNNSGGHDALIMKFNSNGAIAWSTLFGGTGEENFLDNEGHGITIAYNGTIFVSGSTTSNSYDPPVNFPKVVLSGANKYNQPAFGGNTDAFIAMFSPQYQLLWSTYYGGSGFDVSTGAACASQLGVVYFTGLTQSVDFPVKTVTGSYLQTYKGQSDAYILNFGTTGDRQYAMWYGGTNSIYQECGNSIATNQDGTNVVFCGHSYATDFPFCDIQGTADYFYGSPSSTSDAYIANLKFVCDPSCQRMMQEENNTNAPDGIFITPNPAADYINITDNDAAQLKNITIYNALGTPVKIFNNAGSKIYVGDLSAGLYLIRLPDNSGTIQTGRFIISK